MALTSSKSLSVTLVLLLLVISGQSLKQNEHAIRYKQKKGSPEQKMSEVKTLRADLEAISSEFRAQLQDESERRKELEHLVKNFISSSGQTSKVSFFAKYTPNLFKVVPLKANDFLVVNTVVSNEGNAYDSNLGIFTAPFNGTYAFFVNNAPSPNHATVMQLDVVVDGNLVACSARTTSLTPDGLAEGSCQAILNLRKDQTVSLRNLWDDAYYWGGITTFSGVLLHLH